MKLRALANNRQAAGRGGRHRLPHPDTLRQVRNGTVSEPPPMPKIAEYQPITRQRPVGPSLPGTARPPWVSTQAHLDGDDDGEHANDLLQQRSLEWPRQ